MQSWFYGCNTEGAIKSRYRDLARQHHPDLGGDTAIMQDINACYEIALKTDYRRQGFDESKITWRWDLDREILYKVVELMKISDTLTVEICGLWVWVSGNTKTYKDALKRAGCYYAAKKACWYWRRASDKYRRRGKPMDMTHIRAKYGSCQLAETDENKRLTA